MDLVNEMQGKEKKVIIISTVCASKNWQHHNRCMLPSHFPGSNTHHMLFPSPNDHGNRVHGIGFLNNVQRLNTAITRAKCLLVVIGDPYILYQVHQKLHGLWLV
jgi:superfamily I DNA and/or RNA helicase